MPILFDNNAPLDRQHWFQFLTDTVSRDHPQVRALCYPKEIATPPGFMSPSLFTGVAYSCADGVTRVADYMADKTTLNGHIISSLLIRYQMPTFFARPDLCDALMQTEPPQNMKLGDLKMPVPAMLICLPIEFTLRYVGRRAPFLCIAAAPEKMVIDSPLRQSDGKRPRQFELNNPEAGFFMFSVVLEPDGIPAFYDWRAPQSAEVARVQSCEIQYFNMCLGVGDDPEQDKGINVKLAMLGVNLLLAMTAQPELIAREQVIRAAKKKDGRIIRRALWRPNFIGENFHYERAAGAEGSHASPHAHIRRGHMRNQAHGPGLTLRKLIWIKPVFVGLKVAA